MATGDPTAKGPSLEALALKIAALEAKCDAQERDIARLRGTAASMEDSRSDSSFRSDTTSAISLTDHVVSRRGAMKALGAAAAGGVGLAVVSTFIDAQPAAAAGGFGGTNAETTETTVTDSEGASLDAIATGSSGLLTSYVGDLQPGVTGEASAEAGCIGVAGLANDAADNGNNFAIGVLGVSNAWSGLLPTDDDGPFGISSIGVSAGVIGDSESSPGVIGYSAQSDGVSGETSGNAQSGVSGEDVSKIGGFGISGQSNLGTGVYGLARTSSGIVGNPISTRAGVFGDSSVGSGVEGTSSAGDGVHGLTTSAGDSGVFGGDSSGSSGGAGGYGLSGHSKNGTGVYGFSNGPSDIANPITTQAGVFGDSSISYGVIGCSTVQPGVAGVSSAIHGVYGESTAGSYAAGIYGLNSDAQGYGGSFTGGLAPLLLGINGTAGPPTSGTHQLGEIYVDDFGEIYHSVSPEGAPLTWRRVVAAAPNYNNGVGSGSLGLAGSVNLLSAPIRVFDSRVADSPGAPSRAAGVLAPGTAVTVQVAGTTVGSIEVPAGAVGVIGNVTAFSPTGNGKLVLYPTGGSVPSITNLNYQSSDSAIGNLCIVPLGSGSDAGQMNIEISSGSPGSANVAFDVFGFVF
jgi:hypothetical protein